MTVDEELFPDGVDSLFGNGNAVCSALEVKPDDSVSQVSFNGGDDPRPKAKAKAKVKAQANGKGKAKAKAADKMSLTHADCDMCEQEFPIECMAANSNKCLECKLDWNSLGKMAKRQNLMEWWNGLQLRTTEYKRKVWKVFKQRFRALKTVREKRDFRLMEFLEYFKFVSATDVNQTGKMMWHEEALEYWQSTAGGKFIVTDARKKWEELLTDPDHIEDDRGPVHSPRRLYIATGTTITKRTTVERGREVKLGNQKKNVHRGGRRQGETPVLGGLARGDCWLDRR